LKTQDFEDADDFAEDEFADDDFADESEYIADDVPFSLSNDEELGQLFRGFISQEGRSSCCKWLCMIHSSRMEVGGSRMHPLKTREMTSSTKRRRCTMRCSVADPRKYFLALSSSGQKIGC